MDNDLPGLVLLSSLLGKEDAVAQFSRYGLKEKYFIGDEIPVFKLYCEHLSKYGKFPDRDTLNNHVYTDGSGSKRIPVVSVYEPTGYYYDN